MVLFKPDAIERRLENCLIDQIKREIPETRFLIQKYVTVTQDQAHNHYFDHKDQPYFVKITNSLIGKKVMVMVVTGPAIRLRLRHLMGSAINPAPGTLRHSFAKDTTNNSIHCSDSTRSANHEFDVWYPQLSAQHNTIQNFCSNVSKNTLQL